MDSNASLRTSGLMRRIVKATRASLPVVAIGFAISSLATAIPATVHANAIIPPTSQSSADAPPLDANAGPKNIVVLQNTTSNSLLVRGHVQLGRVPSDAAGPVNLSVAENTCQMACDTLAVALQVNLIDRGVAILAPQNAAVAVNAGCSGCHAIAVSIQDNILVDDPTRVPPDVDRSLAVMRQEFARISTTSTSLVQAENDMEGVIAQFQGLASNLLTARDEKVTPAATAAPAAPAQPAAPASTSPAAAPSAGPSPSPAPDPSPTPSAGPASQPAASPSPSSTPQASPSPP
jgi:hypothetical protein